MNLKGLIAISGKAGLYKVAAQGRNNIIVESLDNGKKFPAFATDKISALEDISVYTYDADVPLLEVYTKLAARTNYGKCMSHKENADMLREELTAFLPDYDVDRVYESDIRKLFQWFNILIEKGFITKAEEEAQVAAAVAEEEE